MPARSIDSHAKNIDHHRVAGTCCRTPLAVARQNSLGAFTGRYRNQQAKYENSFSDYYHGPDQHYCFSDYVDFPQVNIKKDLYYSVKQPGFV